MKNHLVPLDAATLRRLAVLAEVDPRTVARFWAGHAVRGLPGHRIERVLRQQGEFDKTKKPPRQNRRGKKTGWPINA